MAADGVQDVVDSLSTLLIVQGSCFDPDFFEPSGDTFTSSEPRAVEPEFIAPPASDEHEPSESVESPAEPVSEAGFRDRIMYSHSWWESDVGFADDAVRYARAALEATAREWQEDILNAATRSTADRCGAPLRRVQDSADGYVRKALQRAVQRIRTALDGILPIPLLPDPYEVEIVSAADLWQQLEALREEYRERAADLSDVGRALQMMLIIGEADSGRWCD
jgi:hypothetical protein